LPVILPSLAPGRQEETKPAEAKPGVSRDARRVGGGEAERWRNARVEVGASSGDPHRRDAPDLVCVLADRPVARELAHLGHIQNRLPCPGGLIAISARDLVLAGNVGGVVCEEEVVVTPGQERVRDRPEEQGVSNRLQPGRDALVPWRTHPGIAILARCQLVGRNTGSDPVFALGMVDPEAVRKGKMPRRHRVV
jgi:hypothetical protein